MDASIEASLEKHLNETQAALKEIEECLGDDDEADKTELIKLKLELEKSVEDTEAALLELKKERILEEFKVTSFQVSVTELRFLGSDQEGEQRSSESSSDESTSDDAR